MIRFRLALPLAVLAAVLPATQARASAYAKVLGAYEQTGTIAACEFSSRQLASALKGVNVNGAQYFADFTAAIQNALSARAAGGCQRNPVPAVGASAVPQGGSPGIAFGRVTAPTQAGIPAPIVLMAVLAAVIAAAAAARAGLTLRGWEPAPLAAGRHLGRELGYRASGKWAEFVDWLRSA